MSNANAGEHASLQSYPDAVLTATDQSSGITVTVEPNGTSLAAKDGAGKQLWSLDVVKQVGKPHTGFPVIRYVEVTAPGTVSIVVGKSQSVEIDLKSGKAKLLGEN
ncbi:hypothetical protein [Mesorhizobium sp. CN2-181]|uniref:hypothetical protein n=1 Tax=Mesorhizobium yinganensis TaxID=3157707 RepID=UPI0032B7C82D